jgi:uncharacterized membrane protein YhaH (DUF805 family)
MKNKKTTISDKYLTARFWRLFSGLWSLVIFVLVILDFITNNGFSSTLGPVAAIYVSVVSIYSAEKEFKRWHSLHKGRHPGELYIILWTVLLIGIVVTDIVLDKPYKVPESIVSAYIAIVGILAVTKSSKKLYTSKEEA